MKHKLKEYYCRRCNKTFYAILENGKKATCPNCGSEDVIVVPKSSPKGVPFNCKCSKE